MNILCAQNADFVLLCVKAGGTNTNQHALPVLRTVSSGVKRQGREALHLPSFWYRGSEWWSDACTPPDAFIA
jgi:hypothetical protein